MPAPGIASNKQHHKLDNAHGSALLYCSTATFANGYGMAHSAPD